MCLRAPPLNFPCPKNVVNRAWFRVTICEGALTEVNPTAHAFRCVAFALELFSRGNSSPRFEAIALDNLMAAGKMRSRTGKIYQAGFDLSALVRGRS